MKKIISLLILILVISQLTALKVPSLKGRINDYAGILNSQEERNLESYLTQFENRSSIQIAVLTIKSLEGENLESYSIKVADEWKIGQPGEDNGVILLVAIQEKKLRIEVGYGLEGYLTDAKSGYIIRNYITPYFKKGEFYNGVAAGVQAITGVLTDELKITDQQIAQSEKEENGRAQIPFGLLIFLFMIFFGGFGRRRRGGLFTALFLGSVLGGGRGRSGGGGFGGFSGGGGGFGGGGASGGW
ncbi:MAG: TPM domain-containing protein [Candidatus Cloacimonetes bacterium]|nr:TPM domain-containing protein [Candidatus Cloacimonadota bacterium]MCF7813324.1 TPM domain-containing protein [Candidatus Cloacimonadota bacterium]MCF7867813.1 TPM domain-containing protein [Candidatus Cloacimonadota bacterium]MCF7883301.1 TPM domain-containing protein [Candidatus Cloacimonadota bacterium]